MLQLEDGAVDLLSKTLKKDRLEIYMQDVEKPRTINEYVQAWKNQIWEHGFMGWFKGKDSYSKTKAFEDLRHMDLAIKRVVFKSEFISQKALDSFSTYIYVAILY
jgi:hypothetical protein